MFPRNFRLVLALLAAGAALAVVAAILVFSGVFPPYYARKFDPSAYGRPVLDYRVMAFSEIAGWMQDDPQAAFSAFLKSCASLDGRDPAAPANPHEFLGEDLRDATFSGTVADWLRPCRAAAELRSEYFADGFALRGALRTFFEVHFQPVEILERRAPLLDGPARRMPPRIEETGLFTGYFEPVYPAARQASVQFSAPVYARPGDLIDVDLGLFRDEWAGERIAGRIEGQTLAPYPDRNSIEEGALTGVAAPIAWMDPNDLFFLQIQGSGRLRFEDGESIRVGYAGQNGHPYTAIGRVMVEREIMPLEEVTMQSIRAWLAESSIPEAQAMRAQNESYVFFEAREATDEHLGPLGAQGVPLTPGRSLAVDRRFHTLGAPVWVDIEPVGALGGRPVRRLMIAQDTGGAIKGPIRGDVYWGSGAEAGKIAGAMRAEGRLYVFLPRPLAERLP